MKNESLPDQVLEALRNGDTIGAIRRLCESTGLGLKEGMDVIEGHLRDHPATTAAPSSCNAFPPSVTDALRRGNKIEAIKLLRKQRGIGLKEAKDAVDEMTRRERQTTAGRPTVDRPPASHAIWWLAGLVLACYAIYRLAA